LKYITALFRAAVSSLPKQTVGESVVTIPMREECFFMAFKHSSHKVVKQGESDRLFVVKKAESDEPIEDNKRSIMVRRLVELATTDH
jgi:hypothetical protein